MLETVKMFKGYEYYCKALRALIQPVVFKIFHLPEGQSLFAKLFMSARLMYQSHTHCAFSVDIHI